MSKFTDEIFKSLETQSNEILKKIGLDPNDPEVLEILSDPCDFDTFNERLNVLIGQRKRNQEKS